MPNSKIMFLFLLGVAIVVVGAMIFYFLKPERSDSRRIVTKLESLDKKIYEEQEEDVFSCEIISRANNHDLLFVVPSGKKDSGRKSLGDIPYDYKARILHFMNTEHLRYKAEFNKSTDELTIVLIDQSESSNN